MTSCRVTKTLAQQNTEAKKNKKYKKQNNLQKSGKTMITVFDKTRLVEEKTVFYFGDYFQLKNDINVVIPKTPSI